MALTSILAGLFAWRANARADGGDFSIDFVASAPFTYSHLTGGGAYDDRTIGKSNDVVESLEAGDFQCGEIVTYLAQITVEAGAAGAQTIQLNHSFLANTTGQPGAGHVDVVNVQINYGPTGVGEGPGTTDAGISDDGGSSVVNVSESFDPPGSVPFGAPEADQLLLTYQVTDLEAGETVVVRIDTRLGCDPSASPTGNLQADLCDASVVAPAPDEIPQGCETIPFKQFGELPTNTPTATATNTPMPTDTPTNTPTSTPTPTSTATATNTATATQPPGSTSIPATNTPTSTPTLMASATQTNTPVPTSTPTSTPTTVGAVAGVAAVPPAGGVAGETVLPSAGSGGRDSHAGTLALALIALGTGVLVILAGSLRARSKSD